MKRYSEMCRDVVKKYLRVKNLPPNTNVIFANLNVHGDSSFDDWEVDLVDGMAEEASYKTQHPSNAALKQQDREALIGVETRLMEGAAGGGDLMTASLSRPASVSTSSRPSSLVATTPLTSAGSSTSAVTGSSSKGSSRSMSTFKPKPVHTHTSSSYDISEKTVDLTGGTDWCSPETVRKYI
jgi:hypothetical protein